MKRIFLTALMAAVLAAAVRLPSFATRAQEVEAKVVDDPEAYAVYASLLPSEWTVQAGHATTLVFRRETGTNWECMPKGKLLETDWRPVVENFRAENASPRLLRAGFPLGIPYLVASSADIKASFSDVPNDPAGWTGFYKRYPGSAGITVVCRDFAGYPTSPLALRRDIQRRSRPVLLRGAECL